jgi:nitrogen fixation protein NifQ
MDPEETYAWLVGPPRRRPSDHFDVHALASIFTVGLLETERGQAASLNEALGLSFDEAVAAIVAHFPHALMEIGPALRDEPVERSEIEACLLDLLWRSAGGDSELRGRLAKILARRSQRPNRFWQDLGLRNRGELSTLMSRHFPRLAPGNLRDIRWKKYLYQRICREPDYALCNRLSCLQCEDFFDCFGEDAGRDPSLRIGRIAA